MVENLLPDRFLSDRGGRRQIADRRFRVGNKYDPDRRTGWKRRSGWDRRCRPDQTIDGADRRAETAF